MKARHRTYEEGVKFGIEKSVEALAAAHVVAMDDRRLCQSTIRSVAKRADFLFSQILEEKLSLDDILEEAKEILRC